MTVAAWAPAAGQEVDLDSVLERLLELERESEELLESLPPGAREEIERRLEAAAAEAPGGSEREEDEIEVEQVVEQQVEEQEEERVEEMGAVVAETRIPLVEPSSETVEAEVGGCNPLAPFDSSQDGALNGSDRYWRHFYLWVDNGDGDIDEAEVKSLFDVGIRRVSLDLESFTTAEKEVGGIGFEEWVVFELPPNKSSVRRGALTVDSDALERGEGPRLLDAGRTAQRGFQPLRPGLFVATEAEELLELYCP